MKKKMLFASAYMCGLLFVFTTLVGFINHMVAALSGTGQPGDFTLTYVVMGTSIVGWIVLAAALVHLDELDQTDED